MTEKQMTSIDLGNPDFRGESPKDHEELRKVYEDFYPSIVNTPRLPLEVIFQQQFERIQWLVKHAFDTVPFYRRKYGNAGFHPEDLRSWEDFYRLPPVTKEELIESWPECVSDRYTTEFTTRSSGSSGKVVTVAVDKKAVMLDTVYGVRQFYAQSRGQFSPNDCSLQIYTCPWWFTSVDGMFKAEFLSTREKPEVVAEAIKRLSPKVLALYPSYLRELQKYIGNLRQFGVVLVNLHSEQSSAYERQEFERHFGIPVLDEYSSEELTRIALECPCHSYHLEEDVCHTEILGPDGKPAAPGQCGEVVGTNLLNQATPLIRYKQGDLAAIDNERCPCGSNFRILSNLNGRATDSFVLPSGSIIPAGTLMDATYHWFLECGVVTHGLQYQLEQTTPNEVILRIVPPINYNDSVGSIMANFIRQVLNNEVSVTLEVVSNIPKGANGKHRCIISRVSKDYSQIADVQRAVRTHFEA